MGTLPQSTTEDDFQELIQAEKEKRHVHERERNWQAVADCVTQIEELPGRQTKLGELNKHAKENCMSCEEQIRTIQHSLNITGGINDVKSAQALQKLDREQ